MERSLYVRCQIVILNVADHLFINHEIMNCYFEEKV